MILEIILSIVAFALLVMLAFLNGLKKQDRYEEPETLLGVVAPPTPPTKTGPKHRKTKGKHRA